MTTDPLASGYNPHPAKGLKTPRAAAAAGILFFGAAADLAFSDPRHRAAGPARPWRLAGSAILESVARAQPDPVRGHRVPVVRRCPPRPDGGGRRQVVCDGLSRKRSSVHRPA